MSSSVQKTPVTASTSTRESKKLPRFKVRYLIKWIDGLQCAQPITNLAESCKNGVLLCQLLETITPGLKFTGLNRRPIVMQAAISNLEKALSMIWQKTVKAKSIPSAQEIYSGNADRIEHLIQLIFESLIIKDMKQCTKEIMPWCAACLAKYDRKLRFPTIPHFDDFSDCVSLLCILHLHTPPSVRFDLNTVYGAPETTEEKEENATLLFSLLDAVGVLNISCAQDFVRQQDDDLLLFTLFNFWVCFKDLPTHPFEPSAVHFRDQERYQQSAASQQQSPPPLSGSGIANSESLVGDSQKAFRSPATTKKGENHVSPTSSFSSSTNGLIYEDEGESDSGGEFLSVGRLSVGQSSDHEHSRSFSAEDNLLTPPKADWQAHSPPSTGSSMHRGPYQFQSPTSPPDPRMSMSGSTPPQQRGPENDLMASPMDYGASATRAPPQTVPRQLDLTPTLDQKAQGSGGRQPTAIGPGSKFRLKSPIVGSRPSLPVNEQGSPPERHSVSQEPPLPPTSEKTIGMKQPTHRGNSNNGGGSAQSSSVSEERRRVMMLAKLRAEIEVEKAKQKETIQSAADAARESTEILQQAMGLVTSEEEREAILAIAKQEESQRKEYFEELQRTHEARLHMLQGQIKSLTVRDV